MAQVTSHFHCRTYELLSLQELRVTFIAGVASFVLHKSYELRFIAWVIFLKVYLLLASFSTWKMFWEFDLLKYYETIKKVIPKVKIILSTIIHKIFESKSNFYIK